MEVINLSDIKSEYSDKVKSRKEEAIEDKELEEMIQRGFVRKSEYGDEWEEVDINEIVNTLAPGAEPRIKGSKIIYESSILPLSVVADVSGYLRVEDTSKKTKKKQYLDKNGKNARNVRGKNGKFRGRTTAEFNKATHYKIKKRRKK